MEDGYFLTSLSHIKKRQKLVLLNIQKRQICKHNNTCPFTCDWQTHVSITSYNQTTGADRKQVLAISSNVSQERLVQNKKIFLHSLLKAFRRVRGARLAPLPQCVREELA